MKSKIIIALLLVAISASAYADAVNTFTLPNGVVVKITEATFQNNIFKVSGCTGGNSLCLINGHLPFGSALELPKTYVKHISVSYQGQSYSLNASDMYDAWGKHPLEVKSTVRYFGGKCFDKQNCQFRGIFSDAAGSFVAEWKVVNGVSNRTVLTDSNDIVNLFMQNIDPPEFE